MVVRAGRERLTARLAVLLDGGDGDAGEGAVSGELAADDREEAVGTAALRVVDDEVAARDGALVLAVRGVRQGADAAVSVEDVLMAQRRRGEEARRLVEQVRQLFGCTARVGGVAVIAEVGGADERVVVPGKDEEGAAVGLRGGEDGVRGAAGPLDDKVAALGAAE